MRDVLRFITNQLKSYVIVTSAYAEDRRRRRRTKKKFSPFKQNSSSFCTALRFTEDDRYGETEMAARNSVRSALPIRQKREVGGGKERNGGGDGGVPPEIRRLARIELPPSEMIYIPRILGASLTHFSESQGVRAFFHRTLSGVRPPSTVDHLRPPTLSLFSSSSLSSLLSFPRVP